MWRNISNKVVQYNGLFRRITARDRDRKLMVRWAKLKNIVTRFIMYIQMQWIWSNLNHDWSRIRGRIKRVHQTLRRIRRPLYFKVTVGANKIIVPLYLTAKETVSKHESITMTYKRNVVVGNGMTLAYPNKINSFKFIPIQQKYSSYLRCIFFYEDSQLKCIPLTNNYLTLIHIFCWIH